MEVGKGAVTAYQGDMALSDQDEVPTLCCDWRGGHIPLEESKWARWGSTEVIHSARDATCFFKPLKKGLEG